MGEETGIFRDALQAEGVDGEVSMYREVARNQDVFRVTTEVNGTRHWIEQSITDRERLQIDNIEQHLAYLAETAARQLREEHVERREWGEKAVEFDPRGELHVTCLRCGETVSESELRTSFTSIMTAESSVPNHAPKNITSLPKQKREFALLALLERECNHYRNI